jgi:hypothetical protein
MSPGACIATRIGNAQDVMKLAVPVASVSCAAFLLTEDALGPVQLGEPVRLAAWGLALLLLVSWARVQSGSAQSESAVTEGDSGPISEHGLSIR